MHAKIKKIKVMFGCIENYENSREMRMRFYKVEIA